MTTLVYERYTVIVLILFQRNAQFFFQVLDRPYANLDRIYVSYEIDRFLLRDGWRNCKFPWCGEITVDRTFWDSLIGVDDNRKGWLRDEVK